MTEIHHVTDTALWVAHYRAEETKRPDALFKDPLAEKLVGERGKRIAESMKGLSLQTRWSIVLRTVVIDAYIREAVARGIDTVINLGAGLDTRPYRMDLPRALQWIEIDYPQMIQHKTLILADDKPKVQLERISLDLADRAKRQETFTGLNSRTKRALILTEGVVPYLTEDQVRTLGQDLHAQPHFENWITEYICEELYRYFQTPKRRAQMKNAPFVFFPKDWMAFFQATGWKPKETRYVAKVGRELKRPMPVPWFIYFLIPFTPKEKAKQLEERMGYVLFER